MPEFQLLSAPPLAGYARDYGTVRIAAPSDLALVSFAIPLGGDADAEAAVTSAYGCAMPAPGRYALSGDGTVRVIRTAVDQGMIAFAHATPDAEPVVAKALKGAVYTTDQTDAWCALAIDGQDSRAVLERICPVDLHPEAFASDMAQRTVMEHMGVLILRTGEDAFLLLSASSSALSFAHAIELSVKNAT